MIIIKIKIIISIMYRMFNRFGVHFTNSLQQLLKTIGELLSSRTVSPTDAKDCRWTVVFTNSLQQLLKTVGEPLSSRTLSNSC